MSMYTGPTLYRALMAEGFTLPDNCGDVELLMPIDGVIALKYTELMTGERLATLGRALVRMSTTTTGMELCDCDQRGNPDLFMHAPDCTWRRRMR